MSGPSPRIPQEIHSTAAVRAFDRYAIESLGIDGFELMRRAGRAAFEYLHARWPAARRIDVYCGAGNNAGDGYLVATFALEAGLKPTIVAITDPRELRGDAAQAAALALDAGVGVEPLGDVTDPARDAPELIVDALLGTGLARALDGVFASAVDRINSASAPVLALDVPSGLDSDSGAIRGSAVRADATVTFVGLKSGLFLGEGPSCCGSLVFADLDLPPGVFAGTAPVMRRIDPEGSRHVLEPRSRTSHKGLNGRVLVVGGRDGMPGAARLAAEAALRAGAGLVHVAAAPESVAAIMAGRPEIMCRGVAGPADCADWLDSADVIVIGPGLGRTPAAEALAAAVLASERPLVVDADALHYLAANPSLSDRRVLTPHPGEAAALLGLTARAVQAARDQVARALVETYGGIVVLKGACSLVGHRSADNAVSLAVCDRGNPGMASGGMGDVLAGVIGGLIAQFGLRPAVVETAVSVHALAGDDAATEGERGLLASDLMAPIRTRVNPQ